MRVHRALVPLAVVAVLALAVTVTVARQDSPQHKVLFEKATFTMETKGDLKGAIALFEEIIKKYPNEREYAAQALLQIGLCYEKLGVEGARGAYQRLIKEYPGQTVAVAAARQRLAGLAAAASPEASKPTFRKITVPGGISEGAQLSPDGSSLAFVTGGDIWVVSLRGRVAADIAGPPVRLTHGAGAAWGGFAWSRSGEWIAFSQGRPTGDIYVVPISGGEPRKLPIDVSPRGGSPSRAALSFSSDGSHIAYSTESQGELALHMASVAAGDDVTRLADPVSTDPAFSPDGKFIAYIKSWEVQPYDSRDEVRIVRLADHGDVRFTEIPLRARSPIWSPDGKSLAFLILPGTDNRSQELWIAPVLENGTASTTPARISLPNATYNSLAGWTTDDKIGVLFDSPSHNAIYTAPLAGGKATQVTPDGDGFSPQWSPDGQRIYFRWGWNDIASVPAAGGQVRVVPQTGVQVAVAVPSGGNHVSPDGKRVVFSGGQVGVPGAHLWTVPVAGGEPARVPMKPDLDAYQPRWSPDGKWIAFESERAISGDRKLDENIFIVSSEGGEPRQLTYHTDSFCELEAWSPAGDSIAYACKDQTIRIIPAKGGEPRVVVKADGLASFYGSLAWTPDGGRLLYTAERRLWTVSTSGGEPTAISTGVDGNIMQFALSPDGKTVAFNAPSGGDPELWLMEDFVHLVKAASTQRVKK